MSTIKRVSDNKFIVSLPMKQSTEILEKQIAKNSELKSKYSEFIEEHERLTYMSEI